MPEAPGTPAVDRCAGSGCGALPGRRTEASPDRGPPTPFLLRGPSRHPLAGSRYGVAKETPSPRHRSLSRVSCRVEVPPPLAWISPLQYILKIVGMTSSLWSSSMTSRIPINHINQRASNMCLLNTLGFTMYSSGSFRRDTLGKNRGTSLR